MTKLIDLKRGLPPDIAMQDEVNLELQLDQYKNSVVGLLQKA